MKYLNNINNIYKTDKQRQGTLPLYQYWYRRTHKSSNVFNKAIYSTAILVSYRNSL